jgi:hypothetical protein
MALGAESHVVARPKNTPYLEKLLLSMRTDQRETLHFLCEARDLEPSKTVALIKDSAAQILYMDPDRARELRKSSSKLQTIFRLLFQTHLRLCALP